MAKQQSFSKEQIHFVLAIIVAVFAVFSAVGTVSYMISWRSDKSVIYAPDLLDEEVQVSNAGGIFGLSWGSFLVDRCIGVAALLFAAVICIVAVKMLSGRKIDWIKAGISAFAGSFFLSLFLAEIALLQPRPLGSLFGHGIAGESSTFLVLTLNKFLGTPVATILTAAMLAVTLILLFPRLSKGYEKKICTDNSGEPVDAQGRARELLSTDPQEAACAEDIDKAEQISLAMMPEIEIQTQQTVAAPIDGKDALHEEAVSEVQIVGPEEEITTDIEEELPQLDIRSDVSRYQFPSLDLLEDYADKRYTIPQDEISRNIERIKTTLASFKIVIDSIKASVGYTVTLYKITLGEGIRVSQVKNLEEDIAVKMGKTGVRVIILPDAVGIEVPNERPSVVPLKAILNSEPFRTKKYELPIALGYTITTKAKVFDLTDAPHLLVAGATKQGKSVGLNAIITSLLYSKHPTELKMVFIDPKMVEFQQYSRLYKHYLAVLPSNCSEEEEAANSIIKDPKSAEAVLRSLCIEMDERYKLLASAGVNKFTDYNDKYRNRHLLPTEGHHFLPYIVVVIDEYADLTKSTFGTDRNMSRSIENSINRLAAKGRAAGLHIIIATQRPSVDVITGTIKGNFPTRMAFRTTSRQDSMTILGIAGAERLMGKGDMLYFSGADTERLQCALMSSDEIERLTKYIASQTGFQQSCTSPYYLPDPGDAEGGSDSSDGGLVDMKSLDPLFEEVAQFAVLNHSISTSMIQRKMSLGFARAGRIMDQLESAGVVGPAQGSKPREALISDMATLNEVLAPFLK